VRGPRDDFAASSPGWVGVWLGGKLVGRIIDVQKRAEFCSSSSRLVRSVPLAESGKGAGAFMGACEPSVQIAQRDDVDGLPIHDIATSTLFLHISLLKGRPHPETSSTYFLSPTLLSYSSCGCLHTKLHDILARRAAPEYLVRLLCLPHTVTHHVHLESPEAVA
jgi:hypothetical protein